MWAGMGGQAGKGGVDELMAVVVMAVTEPLCDKVMNAIDCLDVFGKSATTKSQSCLSSEVPISLVFS